MDNLDHCSKNLAFYLLFLYEINSHILLYIGETITAEKRWKGEHDCKTYLQAYSEACQKAGLSTQLSIRFWKDVPKDTKGRRLLEKKLIKKLGLNHNKIIQINGDESLLRDLFESHKS